MKQTKSIFEDYLIRNKFLSEQDFKNNSRLQRVFFRQYVLIVLAMIGSDIGFSKIYETLSKDPYFKIGCKSLESFRKWFQRIKREQENELKQVKYRLELKRILIQVKEDSSAKDLLTGLGIGINDNDSGTEILDETVLIEDKTETKAISDNRAITDVSDIPFYLKNKKVISSASISSSDPVRDRNIPSPKLPLKDLNINDHFYPFEKEFKGIKYDADGMLFDSFTAENEKDLIPIPDYLEIKRNDDNSLFYIEEQVTSETGFTETSVLHSKDLINNLNEKLKYGKTDFSFYYINMENIK